MENNTVKNIFKATALTCLMAAATNAIAVGPTANVQVKGSVTMGACTPTLDNGGVIDYGDISADSLNDASNRLVDKTVNLTITCSSDTLLSWSTIDNRLGTRFGGSVTNATANGGTIGNSVNQFGLGKTSDNKNIGGYVPYISSQNIQTDDGIDKDLIRKYGDEDVWAISTARNLATGESAYGTNNYTLATKGTLIPVAYKSATFPIVIATALDSNGNLNVTDNTMLDGNMTFIISYN